MKKTKRFLKKYWILVWLIAAVLAFTIIVSAEYMASRNRVRRVVANVADEGQQFSSNYLKVADLELRKVSFNESDVEDWCVIPISIWNHSETNPQKAYQGEIVYNWTMQLVDKDGNLIPNTNANLAGYNMGYSTDGTNYTAFNTLTYDATDGYHVSDTKTFNTTDSNGIFVVDEHLLYIRFPKSVLTSDPEIYVKVTATPTDTKKFSEIASILGAQQSGEIINRGWSGDFSDDNHNYDYDAFNYVISGSGEADITLSWRTDRLEMNLITISEYGWNGNISTAYMDAGGSFVDGSGNPYTSAQTGGTTWKTLTFTADSNATDGSGTIIGLDRYDIQFYMVGDPDTDYGSGDTFWDTVKEYVSFSAD